jgi:hypothetical protein
MHNISEPRSASVFRWKGETEQLSLVSPSGRVNQLIPRSRVVLDNPVDSQLVKKSPHFMEEGSLPYSQQPITCHYAEPD